MSEATAASGPVWALGLMSGTSMDGIDAALVHTDGEAVTGRGPSLTRPYDPALRDRLARAVGGGASEADIAETGRRLTAAHAEAVAALLARWQRAEPVAVIGFHGHTLWHRPESGTTRQLGDGALLARLTGGRVVTDFRSADMAAGGEGAPLAPLYHFALAHGAGLDLPAAILNLGGVANVTWIGPGQGGPEGRLMAFDTGPGCALLDDWAAATLGRPIDEDGALARAGRVDGAALRQFLDDPYFRRPPPKSLDRFGFDLGPLASLSAADGAATLTAFTAEAVARARDHLPAPPRVWLVTGGGRRNPALMAALTEALGKDVRPVEAVGWDGDSLEAEAFAYLAVRSLRGLPLSLPATTGAPAPIAGGRLFEPGGTGAAAKS